MAVQKVKKGDTVKVHYTGTLDDGEVFDSSENRDPLSFQAGGGQVIKGFDEGILGMAVGEEKQIKILAKDAYGERNETLKQSVPKSQLPPNLKDAKKGMFLRFMAPNGQPISVMIADETADEIVLDMNPPLAGKNLNFKVKIVAIGE